MKKSPSFLKILIITLVLTMLATLLSACGLFNSLVGIENVDIISSDGNLQKSGENQYIARVGTAFTLDCNWHNQRVNNPDIEWHMALGEDDEKLSSKKTLEHVFGMQDEGKSFVFYVIVNEVKSDNLSVAVVQAELSSLQISSSSHDIVSGIAQCNLMDGVSAISLFASWNESDISPARNVTLAWFVDGNKQTTADKNFVLNVSGISEACTIFIKVVLYEDGEQKIQSEVKIVFVKEYLPIDSVSVMPKTDLKELCDGTYYLQSSSSQQTANVNFTSTVSPLGANQSAQCEWTLTTSSGKNVLSGTEREKEIVLQKGKNVLKVSAQNVESRSIIVYLLDYAIDQIPQNVKEHIQNKFFFLGDYRDYYVSNQEDMNAFVGYAVARHQTGVDFTAYLAETSFRDRDAFGEACSTAIECGVDESGSFSYVASVNGSIGKISFSEKTVFGVPMRSYENPMQTVQIGGYLRYCEQEIKRESLPIDGAKESMAVANSNDLYRAVSAGFKPIFESNASGERLSALYQKARDVLLTYIGDDMSDVDKLGAIYDWIVNVVDYDYALASQVDGNETCLYNAFYLEGVFDDHRAVCDGKSKAFALLCGMEGIKCVRVCGYADSNLASYDENDRTNASFGHAWNKVLVDVDGDGIREWYAVDTTWGDIANKTSSKIYEYLSYAYFLKTDEQMKDTHLERTLAPKTTTVEYNVYKNTYINVNGTKVDLWVESIAERDVLLKYSQDNGCLTLCVYLAPYALGTSSISYGSLNMGDGQYVIYAKALLI